MASRLSRDVKDLLKCTVSSEGNHLLQRAAGRGQFSLYEEIPWEEISVFAYGYVGHLYVYRSDWYG